MPRTICAPARSAMIGPDLKVGRHEPPAPPLLRGTRAGEAPWPRGGGVQRDPGHAVGSDQAARGRAGLAADRPRRTALPRPNARGSACAGLGAAHAGGPGRAGAGADGDAPGPERAPTSRRHPGRDGGGAAHHHPVLPEPRERHGRGDVDDVGANPARARRLRSRSWAHLSGQRAADQRALAAAVPGTLRPADRVLRPVRPPGQRVVARGRRAAAMPAEPRYAEPPHHRPHRTRGWCSGAPAADGDDLDAGDLRPCPARRLVEHRPAQPAGRARRRRGPARIAAGAAIGLPHRGAGDQQP